MVLHFPSSIMLVFLILIQVLAVITRNRVAQSWDNDVLGNLDCSKNGIFDEFDLKFSFNFIVPELSYKNLDPSNQPVSTL